MRCLDVGPIEVWREVLVFKRLYIKGKIMKKIIILSAMLSLASGLTHGNEDNNISVQSSVSESNICLLSGMPPSDYKYNTIKNIKYGKNGYGSVNTVIPLLVDEARGLGADAIIGYVGGQRFGFWPWQFIRPVVRGVAVTWVAPEKIDCEGIGGTFKTQLKGPLTTNV